MRLSNRAQEIIRESAREIFGHNARVMLFGSRVDDSARGGDIDLLVHSEESIEQREKKVLQLVARLQIRLGDQPIDVLVIDPKTQLQPVHEQALKTGVIL